MIRLRFLALDTVAERTGTPVCSVNERPDNPEGLRPRQVRIHVRRSALVQGLGEGCSVLIK